MKKLLLTLAAMPAAVMATQASAQSYANDYGSLDQSTNLEYRISNLEARFNEGVQMRAFSQSEINRLYPQLVQLRRELQQDSYDGRLTSGERRNLQARIRMVRNEMRLAGGDRWASRYGWNDRDLDAYGSASVRYDAYGRPISNGNIVYDQYGRPIVTNNYYGSGGPYEPVYAPRSNGVGNILGGVLGSVVGGGGLLGGGGLGVGSVITSVIANALRGGNDYGYRDTRNTYFRSDGQQVYEIDARTNRVVRIHPLR